MASWRFSGDFGTQSTRWGVKPRWCRPRGSPDESPAPFTLKLSLLYTSPLTRHPVVSGQTVFMKYPFAAMVLLCQVPSSYNALLELFSQRRSLPWLSLRLRDVLPYSLTTSSPRRFKRCAEATWKKHWRVRGSCSWAERRTPCPFSTSRGNLLWAREHARNSPQASSIDVYNRLVVVRALGRCWVVWQRSCWMMQFKYKVVFEPIFINVNGKSYLLCEII